MLTAQTASGDPNGSALFMVLVFASVAIGGSRFGGGRGSAIGSILGAGVLAVLQKMLFALGVSTFYTGIVQGAVLILAVLLGQVSLGLAQRSRVSQSVHYIHDNEPTETAAETGGRS
jgi:ribose transport system permease protein